MKVYPLDCNACLDYISTDEDARQIKCGRSVVPLDYGSECPLTKSGE